VTLAVSNLTVRDIPDVLSISVECGLCLWSSDAYRSELVRDDTIMLKLTNQAEVTVGFAVGRIFNFSGNEFVVELTNIGIRQAYRNQGFGSLLLKSFLERCSVFDISSVILEVRVSNVNAINFYKKFGFIASGHRRGFYANPLEDALTMNLVLDHAETVKTHT